MRHDLKPAPEPGKDVQPRLYELIDNINRSLASYSTITSAFNNKVDLIGGCQPDDKADGKVQSAPNSIVDKLEDILSCLDGINHRFESAINRLEKFI